MSEPPEPPGSQYPPRQGDDTMMFIAQNPHVAAQADAVWGLLLHELVGEMHRIDDHAREQNMPSPVNIAFMNWLGEEMPYKERFNRLAGAAMGALTSLQTCMGAQLGIRENRQTGIATLAHLRTLVADLHRFFDLREAGCERVFYAVTHPGSYDPISIVCMVGGVFTRLAAKYGIDPVSDDVFVRLAHGVMSIVAAPSPQ